MHFPVGLSRPPADPALAGGGAPSRHPAASRVFAALIVAGSAAAIASAWQGFPSHSFWFWLATCFAAELLWVRMPLGNVTLSMASACNFAALLLLPRGEAMVAAAGAGLLAEALVMKKPPVRFIFNAAQSALAVAASAWMLEVTGGGATFASLLAEHRFLPLMAAAASYTAVNYGAVSAIVALCTGVSLFAAWHTNFGSRYEQISNAALFSIGLMIALLWTLAGPLGTVIASVPLLLSWMSYRHFTRHAAKEREAADQRAA